MRHVLASALVFCASASIADPVMVPSPDDIRRVEAAIAPQLREPESMILSDIIAVADPAATNGTTWICGLVRGRNAFGGYANPQPFVSMAIDNPLGGQRGIAMVRIAESPRDAAITMDICASKVAFARLVDEAGPEVREQIVVHSRFEAECVLDGVPSTACTERDLMVEQLGSRGLCPAELGNWVSCQ